MECQPTALFLIIRATDVILQIFDGNFSVCEFEVGIDVFW